MIIYKVTNKVNSKCYIGQTINPLYERKKGHKYAARERGRYSYFYNAIRKYGWDNFSWEVVCECGTTEELNDKEVYYIGLYGDYNLAKGGNSRSGYKHSEKYKQNMSRVLKGRIFSDEHRKNLSVAITGIQRTKEHKESLCKSYIIISPNGEVFDVTGLRKFCREHKLDTSTMSAVANGKRKHHKQWACYHK